ncbi:MAG: FG-GAP-like repeat-containing protein, partial [Bifidobacteriaceae bacterium]|nr:FG-GAP-like repeat-containing protein [Bifidobacteriaceae bacterium]
PGGPRDPAPAVSEPGYAPAAAEVPRDPGGPAYQAPAQDQWNLDGRGPGWIASSQAGQGAAAEASEGTYPASDAPPDASPESAAPAALTPAEFEAQLTALVNETRRGAGLKELAASTAVSNVARNWSATMARTGLFYHNPDYFTQMPQANLWGAGENIQWASASTGYQTPAQAHQNFMNSPGHRANLMDAAWTHVGIGVVLASKPCPAPYQRLTCYETHVTQNFGAYSPTGPNDPPSWAVPRGVPPFSQVLPVPDMTGDGRGEVLGIDAEGKLVAYPVTASLTLGPAIVMGRGFAGWRLVASGDWTGDDFPDVVGMDRAGILGRFTGRPGAALGQKTRIGSGWKGFIQVIAGDYTGDGKPDILAVDPAGKLWLYRWSGAKFLPKKQAGYGWRTLAVQSAGDVNGDGAADLMAVDRAGLLLCWNGRGDGSFRAKRQCGSGWRSLQVSGGADLTGDGIPDVLGLSVKTRELNLYRSKGGGRLAPKKLLARGW